MLAGFLPSTVSPVFHMLFLHWFLRSSSVDDIVVGDGLAVVEVPQGRGFQANHITHANLKIWVFPKIVGFPPKSSMD